MLPEFSTEAGRVSREKEPRESVDRNFEVLKSLGAEEILGVIEHKQAVKVEERTEPPCCSSRDQYSEVEFGGEGGEGGEAEPPDPAEVSAGGQARGVQGEGEATGLVDGGALVTIPPLPEAAEAGDEREMIKVLGNNRTSFSHSFQLWLIRSKFREL